MTQVETGERLWALWALARPSQLALIAFLYLLGALIALREVPLDRTALVGGLLALLPVAVSVHYVNEYADYETDARTERTPFSGGSGALQRTGLDRSFARRAAWPALAVGLAAAGICLTHGLPLSAVAVLAVIGVLGWQYSVGLALVYRGVGEVTNAVLGGLLLPVYGGATQTGGLPVTVGVAMAPFTVLVMVNLLATHWPDRAADAAVGKRTLVTRWDPPRLRRAYAAFTVLAASLLLALTGSVVPPVVTAASLPAFVVAAYGYRVYTRQRSPFPAVAAMVTLAVGQAAGWVYVLVG
ncbi:prenyltransferase [Halapricum sp. CBA1109]|uniref:prenyltransferase n=1 Tax=Halapricum sp. CBA1109 TaxID=2668068 RepID=UPI0013B648F4|nr:prenyltransferase [Halapricum sp. CBA1109]